MPGSILRGSITLAVGVALAAVSIDAQAPAQTALQTPVATPAATLQPNQDPQALGGIWKLNKELSSDTSMLQTQADNAQAAGDSSTRRRTGGGGGGFGGFGGRGGSGGRPPSSSSSNQAVQMRALLREMADQPAQETIVVTTDTTTLTDGQGVVRKFATNGRKETIELGAAQVDSVSKWDSGVLTVELSAGSFTLTETYQLTIQGHELVVALSSTDSGSRQSGVPTPAPVKRIYDKADAGG